MNIDTTLLADIQKTFSAIFNKATCNASTLRAKRDIVAEDLAMMIVSTGSATQHSWINQIPGFKKWVSERTIEKLNAGTITVVNEDFEDTISVSRNAIEDDSYQMFAPLVAAMGEAARDLWLDLAIKALIANSNWADGNPFFCSGRKFSDDGDTVTNASTNALTPENLSTAIASMRSWKLHGTRTSGALPRYLIVGPALETTAAKICESDLVSNGTTTESNIMKGVLEVKVHADIPTGQWYIIAEKNGIKPVAVQKRKEATFTSMNSETDTNVFMRNEILYGAHARGEAFLTMPFLGYVGGLSSAPATWDEA